MDPNAPSIQDEFEAIEMTISAKLRDPFRGTLKHLQTMDPSNLEATLCDEKGYSWNQGDPKTEAEWGPAFKWTRGYPRLVLFSLNYKTLIFFKEFFYLYIL